MGEAKKSRPHPRCREAPAYVRAMLKKGRYDDASLTGWGRLDELLELMISTGLSGILDEIRVRVDEEAPIPRWFVHSALALKLVVGERGIAAMQEGMLRDEGLLRILGCSRKEIEEGFDPARNKHSNKPCHVDSLRYSLEHTKAEEFEEALRKYRRKLWEIRGLKSSTYLLDATKIPLYGDYEGVGTLIRVEGVKQKSGKWRERKVEEKGFKLVTLNRVVKGQLLVEAVRLIPINQNEIEVSDELIEEILAERGEGAIGLLLIDRGFLDGGRLRRWKERGIYTLVPLKQNMAMLKDMEGLVKISGGVKAERGKDLCVWGYADLETLDSYGGKLNGLLVTRFRGRELREGQRWGFATTMPVNTVGQVLRAYDLYDERSLVENKEYRELKQGWFLRSFSGKKASEIAYHTQVSLMLLNLIVIYKLRKGRKDKKVLGKGIRRLRRQELTDGAAVVVLSGESYAVMKLSEFAALLGRPPTGSTEPQDGQAQEE